MKQTIKRDIFNLTIIVAASIVVALGLHVFVYKADFAPSGIDGLATILQYLSEKYLPFKINAGIFNFVINLPLLIAAWFVLKKRFVIYTLVYSVIVSAALVLFAEFNVPQYDCTLEGTFNSHIVAAIFGGLAQGLTGIILKLGGSGGGVDVIASMIQKKNAHKNVENLIAYLSYAVVLIGFIVYGNLNSVCLSIIEIFVCEKVTAVILKPNRSAVKFEIVTSKPNTTAIKNAIFYELRHAATLIDCKGAFSEQDKDLIVCLVSYRQIPEFLKILKEFPETFVYYSDITGVRGNFMFEKHEETDSDAKLLEEKKKQLQDK